MLLDAVQAGPIYAARQGQSGCAVESLLCGAQRREVGQARVCGVKMRAKTEACEPR